jgi:predicted PurR-regulated permease PerM
MESMKLPIYVKSACILIAGYALIYGLYLEQNIIVPIVFATLIAVLLNPFVNFLIRKRFNKIVAISMAVLLTFAILAGLVFIISTQLSMFADNYPQLKVKTEALSQQSIIWISEHLNLKVEKINIWLKKTAGTALSDFGPLLASALLSMTSAIMAIFLMPVYLFMILYYKPLLQEFIRRLFSSGHRTAVLIVLDRSKGIVQSYLKGLCIEFLAMSVMNSAGLFILGIDYALILGIIAALLNVIPYIGGVIAVALPMIVAFVTKDTIYSPLMVLGLYIFIQFIDNHYITPKVVASKVKLNALVSVVVVLIGNAIWGVSGMFLSIPITAILKVVFDNVEGLKPWGFLLGNVVPSAKKRLFVRPNKKS